MRCLLSSLALHLIALVVLVTESAGSPVHIAQKIRVRTLVETAPLPKLSPTKERRPAHSEKKVSTAAGAPNVKKREEKKNRHTQAEQEQLATLLQSSLSLLNKEHASAPTSEVLTARALECEKLTPATRYEEELIGRLEAEFALPQPGEVKLTLTLARDGSVKKVQIVHASSEKNRSYVETTVAAHTFLPFGPYYKGERTHTFSVTLKQTD